VVWSLHRWTLNCL